MSPSSYAFMTLLRKCRDRPLWSADGLRPVLVRHDREIDALALGSRREAEVIHRQTLCRAPVNAKRAANARPLVDEHYGSLRTQFGTGHFGELDVTVDRVDALGRDHLDASDRADIDTVSAEDAAIAVD